MKLLTLNTHSHIEPNDLLKCREFTAVVEREKPHIITLQEVNQTQNAPLLDVSRCPYYTACEATHPMRADNHAWRLFEMLSAKGLNYYFVWLPIKEGYGMYDEGVAILSLSPILETHTWCVSRTEDYHNWKTRKILGVLTQDAPHVWFYSVHFGFWQDREEPFSLQWQTALSHWSDTSDVILAGDFNNPAERRGEGYDMVKASGFFDVFSLANCRMGDVTVQTEEGSIDGWRDVSLPRHGMRIDQIWTKKPYPVSLYQVIFDGQNAPVVSDHFGVLAEICLEERQERKR